MTRILFLLASTALLYLGLAVASHLLAGAVEQPVPLHPLRDWLAWRIPGSLDYGLHIAGMMLVITSIDLAVRRVGAGAGRPIVAGWLAYYPRFWCTRCWLLCPRARMTIVVGSLVLAAFHASHALAVFEVRQWAGGMVWPPEALCGTLLLAWGLFWLADCFVRPRRETWLAAILYLGAIGMIWSFEMTRGSLRE